jgi:hypothetical protein
MPGMVRNKLKDLSRRNGFWPGQMPNFIDCFHLSAKHCETGRDIGDVAVGVGKIGIANEVSSSSGQRIPKDPFA